MWELPASLIAWAAKVHVRSMPQINQSYFLCYCDITWWCEEQQWNLVLLDLQHADIYELFDRSALRLRFTWLGLTSSPLKNLGLVWHSLLVIIFCIYLPLYLSFYTLRTICWSWLLTEVLHTFCRSVGSTMQCGHWRRQAPWERRAVPPRAWLTCQQKRWRCKTGRTERNPGHN